MIARFRPLVELEEIVAALTPSRPRGGCVQRFEAGMARTFDASAAVAFPYGRSALWAFLKALDIEKAEVIQPAYTCVVVAHATVLSGNVPRFVDVSPYDFNMNLDNVEAAITPRTRVIVATHLFGFPLDVDRLTHIVRSARAKYGHKIWVIQDCAHAFGARWHGRPVAGAGDAALFGLNISKLMTSVFGGMLTTNDGDLAKRLRDWRDDHFSTPGVLKALRRRLYLLSVPVAFSPLMYGAVRWITDETPLLDRLTKAYHLDAEIRFPPDYLDRMLDVEARVGLAQLKKYDRIVAARQTNAKIYTESLSDLPSLRLPPLVEGATYSHYVVRVASRERFVRRLREHGVELGQLIQYSVPHLDAYRAFAGGERFPVSLESSRCSINLPIDARVTPGDRARVVEGLRAAAAAEPTWAFAATAPGGKA